MLLYNVNCVVLYCNIGEANIARYLNRLLQNEKVKANQIYVDSLLIDESIDKCVNELVIAQNKDSYVEKNVFLVC